MMAYAFCLTLLLASPLQQQGPAHVVLSGRVLGSSGRNPVYVALWNRTGFLKQPVQSLRLEPGGSLLYRFDIIAGPWAVSAFEDRNGNGSLDMGVFGPKEPSGFWRPFHAWRKPRFDDVVTTVEHDVLDADIVLK